MKLFVFSITAMLFLTFNTLAQNSKFESVYTSLVTQSCKTLEQSNEGSGYYLGECKGVGGYKLRITEGDIRQSLIVVKPGGKTQDLDFTGNISTGFSSIGDKAEWRVVRSGKTITPKALIVRYNVSEDPSDSTVVTSYLVVTKITKNQVCITNVVKPGAKANEEARQFADESSNKPCVSPRT